MFASNEIGAPDVFHRLKGGLIISILQRGRTQSRIWRLLTQDGENDRRRVDFLTTAVQPDPGVR